MALYRTYRPGRLADVIGQPQVTAPLARALDSGRAHHAYLFTGPRGCGKTSTARILARSLNCEKGPTSEPCGICQSCQDLAPDGPGSIDVVEMDAATHGLVDDARDLREKAMYAPVANRYKIYIIDEAHQLGPGASNALLKLIEEPPPHLRFVFATTEPDKIIATVRSRTHQYPFRLVSLRRLQEHLAWVCEQEGVPAEPAALALAARAGAGSVRDSLSILGQLIASSDEAGVTYEGAVGQLGFTDVTLLEQTVDALAVGDGASLFGVVEQVVEGGIDPRRFATDLLERLRDLLVLHQVPGAIEAGLLDLPDADLEVVRRQGEALGLGQLSRAADLVSAGLSELKGATAPRLQLELLCARLLLPAVDDSDAGVLARLDRVERQLAFLAAGGAPLVQGGAQPAAAMAVPAAADTGAGPATPSRASARPAHPATEPAPVGSAVPPQGEAASQDPESPPAPASAPPRRPRPAPAAPDRPRPSTTTGPPRRPQPSAARSAPAASDSAADSAASTRGPAVVSGQTPGPDGAAVPASAPDATDHGPTAAAQTPPQPEDGPRLETLRSAWPSVLDALKQASRVAFMEADGTVPMAIHGHQLVVGHPDPVRMKRMRSNAGNLGRLALAVLDVVRIEVEIDLVLGVGVPGATPVPSTDDPGPTVTIPEPAVGGPAPGPADDDADPDDRDVEASELAPLALIQRELGGSVVQEFDRPS